MGEGHFLDIIFLAMVAAFVFFRLRSVLGRRTGHERQRGEGFGNGGQGDDNVVRMPKRPSDAAAGEKTDTTGLWAEESPVGAGLTQIKIADHNFEPESFLGGARAAYEMIVEAFAAGDQDALRGLLGDEVYGNFCAAIDERAARGETLESSIVAINKTDIVEARLNGQIAEVTVKFVSHMISVLRGADGEPAPGQMTGAREVTDIWTFARDTRSRDPNWQLVETGSEN
jgi:predicted lipid-binding transport protein (Tim44 family)